MSAEIVVDCDASLPSVFVVMSCWCRSGAARKCRQRYGRVARPRGAIISTMGPGGAYIAVASEYPRPHFPCTSPPEKRSPTKLGLAHTANLLLRLLDEGYLRSRCKRALSFQDYPDWLFTRQLSFTLPPNSPAQFTRFLRLACTTCGTIFKRKKEIDTWKPKYGWSCRRSYHRSHRVADFANSKLGIFGGSVWSHRRFSHLKDRP